MKIKYGKEALEASLSSLSFKNKYYAFYYEIVLSQSIRDDIKCYANVFQMLILNVFQNVDN